MRVISAIPEMQRASKRWLEQKHRIAFVPTMGCLHEGHLGLIKRARREAGAKGKVVVSIYVNSTQFGPTEDFSRYPRPLKRDLQLCRQAGADLVFTPTEDSMYSGKANGQFSTYVVEGQLSQAMEGRSRPTHFRGVATVVLKLFNIVKPTLAMFGAKDWQQTAIIKRMVANLNLPVRIVVASTVREPDGLAMSSRNQYLSAGQRQQATVLWRSIRHARKRVRNAGVPSARLRSEIQKLIGAESEATLDYVEFFEGDTLTPLKTVRHGAHMALAVLIGKTRLIDNGRL